MTNYARLGWRQRQSWICDTECNTDHGSGTDDNRNLTLLTPNLFVIRALEGLQVAGEEKDILKEI